RSPACGATTARRAARAAGAHAYLARAERFRWPGAQSVGLRRNWPIRATDLVRARRGARCGSVCDMASSTLAGRRAVPATRWGQSGGGDVGPSAAGVSVAILGRTAVGQRAAAGHIAG